MFFCIGTVMRSVGYLHGPLMIMFMHVFVLCMYFSGYLYFEALKYAKHPILRILFLWSLFIIALILLLKDLNSVNNEPRLFYLGFCFSFGFGIIALLFGIQTMIDTLHVYENEGVKLDTIAFIIVNIGNVFYFIMGVLVGGRFYELESPMRTSLIFIGTSFYVLAIIVFFINSLKNREYIYIIPIPIHRIMIYDAGGICIYNRTTAIKNEKVKIKTSPILVTGALNAFSIFFKEILGTNANIRHIDVTTSEFNIFPLPDNKGSLIFISSGANYFLFRSMKEFCAKIPMECLNMMNSSCSIDEIEQKFDDLIRIMFPYLNPIKLPPD